ncbi:rhodanese-like domain-containing protein [Paracoccus sp. SSK6]|uniref:rhodanese-like domain-containing protein n=1 Tax=Paracoccus sp. SSK6 TaxID=3143131 RepID=UPI0032190011
MKDLVAEAKGRVATVSPEHAATSEGSATLVLDVREPGELETHGRVPDALHVPRGLVESRADATAQTAETRLTDLRDTGCVHVLCGSGARAALAADTLRAMGYQARVIEGGFEAWKAKGLPVET